VPDDFLIIAHRGASGRWPENTLLAFRKALDAGAKWLELDVHLSVDSQLVVIHDETLQRTTNGCGRVDKLSLAELRRLDAGMGESIPLLTEVLALAAGRAAVNVELKGANTGVALGQLLVERKETDCLVAEILASSLYEKELRSVSMLLSELRLAVVAEQFDRQLWQLAEELDLWSLNLSKQSIDKALIAKAQEQQRRLLAFTVNEPEEVRRLKSWGLDGVFTDFPERFSAD